MRACVSVCFCVFVLVPVYVFFHVCARLCMRIIRVCSLLFSIVLFPFTSCCPEARAREMGITHFVNPKDIQVFMCVCVCVFVFLCVYVCSRACVPLWYVDLSVCIHL